MSYETAAFGKADGSNVTTDVNQHYGAFNRGGTVGVTKTEGLYSEFAVNVDSEGLPTKFPIGNGALIKEVVADFSTGAITAFTIGGVDISAADGSALNDVELASSNTGVVVLTGPTAGTVVVRYLKAPAA